VRERFVIREHRETAPLQHVTKMANPRVYCKQFPIKGRILLLGNFQLLGKETKWLARGLPW
jgi:cell division inhibitor SulA